MCQSGGVSGVVEQVRNILRIHSSLDNLKSQSLFVGVQELAVAGTALTEWPVVVSSYKFPRHVLTNEVCTARCGAFFVLASNSTTVWLCLVKSVSFISICG